jgi:hypothetical protein
MFLDTALMEFTEAQYRPIETRSPPQRSTVRLSDPRASRAILCAAAEGCHAGQAPRSARPGVLVTT